MSVNWASREHSGSDRDHSFASADSRLLVRPPKLLINRRAPRVGPSTVRFKRKNPRFFTSLTYGTCYKETGYE